MRIVLILSLLAASVCGADKLTAPQLGELAKSNPAALPEAITSSFDAKDLKGGTAWAGHGPDFFFATESPSQPTLFIDDAPGPAMHALTGGNLWYATATIAATGKLHAFYYKVNGERFGGRLDLPVFGPL